MKKPDKKQVAKVVGAFIFQTAVATTSGLIVWWLTNR